MKTKAEFTRRHPLTGAITHKPSGLVILPTYEYSTGGRTGRVSFYSIIGAPRLITRPTMAEARRMVKKLTGATA